jgi:hypothetical protein
VSPLYLGYLKDKGIPGHFSRILAKWFFVEFEADGSGLTKRLAFERDD